MLSNFIKVVLCGVLVVGPLAPDIDAQGFFARIRSNMAARQSARQSARAAYSQALNSAYGTSYSTSYGSSGSSGYSSGSNGGVGRYVVVEEVVESEGSTGGYVSAENVEVKSFGSTGGTATYAKPVTRIVQPIKRAVQRARCYINERGQRVCPLGSVKSVDVLEMAAPITKVEVAVVDIKAPIESDYDVVASNG
jgi:hypothetical protein